jgi:DNA-binding NarL/FixJ family response regulator
LKRRLRVVIGDDHALMITGIRALLEPRHEIVGAAADGRRLVVLTAQLKPDLVILDVSMPELNGLEAARQIKANLPGVKLIFLSMHTNPLYLRKAMDLGASAYVLKAGVIEELLEAIDQVAAGRTYVSAGFAAGVIESLHVRSDQGEEVLTGRQREILQLIAEGKLGKEIAHQLGISIKTVEFHRGRIMARLGVHSAAELVRTAMEQGLIAPSTPDEP